MARMVFETEIPFKPGVVVHQSQFRDQQVMTNRSSLRVRKLGHDPGHQVVMECHSP